MSVHYADAAQRISRVRPTLPALAVVLTFEDNPSLSAGSQQAMAVLVVADRTDVLVRQAVLHVLPAAARIRTAEGAFPGSNHDFFVRSNGQTANAADERSQSIRILPLRTAVGGSQHSAACGQGNQIAVGLHRDKVFLPHDRPTTPALALIRAGVEPSCGRRQPALGSDLDVADFSGQHRAHRSALGLPSGCLLFHDVIDR